MKWGTVRRLPTLHLPGFRLAFIITGRWWPLKVAAWSAEICGQPRRVCQVGNLYVVFTREGRHGEN